MIVASLLVISLETLPDLSPRARVVLYWAEVVIVGVFTAEYLARIYAAPKKLGFIFSFWGLVDLLAILPIYLLIFGIDYNLLVLRTLRLMKLARIVRFVRFNKSFRRLSLALDIAKQDLILAVLATCLIQFIASVGIYQFENPVQPEKFSSVFASLWWALATLTIGINDLSIAFNKEQLSAKVEQIANILNCDVIVESYLPGREFSVRILENENSGVLTAMPIEIIAPENNHGQRVLNFSVKRLDQEEVILVKNKRLHEKLSALGKSANVALGGRSFGRIDVKLCAMGLPHFIEANLMPGLSKGYFYRSCAMNLGMTYDEMILLLCRNRLDGC